MKIIKPSFEILSSTGEDIIKEQLKIIELAGRNCYKSEDRITEDSYTKMIGMLRSKKHLSVLEHGSLTVRIICSRATSHQLVRHRFTAVSQESQRYVNYSKGKHGSEITFIEPEDFDDWSDKQKLLFMDGLTEAESRYMELISNGLKPEDARGILPNSCKTELVITKNLRSWIDLFELRCDPHAQSEIRNLSLEMLDEFNKLMPVVFSDVHKKYHGS